MKDILIEQINEAGKGFKARFSNGWKHDELNAYIAGAVNTLSDMVNKLEEIGTLTSQDSDELCDLLDEIAYRYNKEEGDENESN